MTQTAFKPLQDAGLFLALQRTQYQPKIQHAFRAFKIGHVFEKMFLPKWVSKNGAFIFSEYYKEMKQEFEQIKAYLPKDAKNILDIGCGLGGVDVFISSHYNHTPIMTMLDKNGQSKVYYGFEKDGAFYNELSGTKEFLSINGVPENNIRTINMHNESFPIESKFDVILSRISWCFHYPVDIYLNEVAQTLAPNGVLIVEVRDGTDAIEKLTQALGVKPEVIEAYYNRKLVCFKRPA